MNWKSIALTAGLFGFLVAGAQAEEPCNPKNLTKSGTFTVHSESVGFLVSVHWGDGVLTLNDGETHKFKVIGGKLIETGFGETHIKGEVFNLNKVEDFNGVYYGSSSESALVKGLEGGIIAKNSSNCIYLHGKSAVEGVRLSPPAPGAVQIKLLD